MFNYLLSQVRDIGPRLTCLLYLFGVCGALYGSLLWDAGR